MTADIMPEPDDTPIRPYRGDRVNIRTGHHGPFSYVVSGPHRRLGHPHRYRWFVHQTRPFPGDTALATDGYGVRFARNGYTFTRWGAERHAHRRMKREA